MDFDFTDDQYALRDAVARWVERAFRFERRHALARAGGHARAVWGELAELGLAGLAIDPAHGGMGCGPVEAMVVLEELGRGLVHAPFAQGACIAPALLATSPLASAWLPRLATGQALVVLAHQERGARYRLDHCATRARTLGDGRIVLDGVKSLVPAGDEADAFLVPAHDGEALRLYLVEAGAAGVGRRGYPTQDGARAAELNLAGAPAQLVGADGAQALATAQALGIAAACAEGVGVMERLLAVTVEYLNTRKQFGVPIASFQALRHRTADAKMQLELARSMSYYATLMLAQADATTRERALAQAKVQLGQSMRFVGQQCIQMHGGIGVTDEYVASHYFKRLTVLELSWGDTQHHLGEASARLRETAGVFA